MTTCTSFHPHDKSTKLTSSLSSEDDITGRYNRQPTTSGQESDVDILKTPKTPPRQVNPNKTLDSSLKRNGARSGGCGKRKKSNKPRWHTQMYIMFLALRQHPKREASRTELIKAAVALDKIISEERGLPRVFTGKTPMNSASACLTTNGDKYFIPFKPEGAKSTHFRLAYEPGNFESARAEYNKWMEKLIKYDWPLCFGKRLESSVRDRAKADNQIKNSDNACAEANVGDNENTKVNEVEELDSKTPKSVKQEMDEEVFSTTEDVVNHESKDLVENNLPNPAGKPRIKLSCPTRLEEIVVVRDSSISNAGCGLRAVRFIPAWTPLGFYFGVPMTEDEFDSLKDGVGLASHYSIMYRRTILDATDEKGMPFSDPEGPIWCPYHFMNEDVRHGNVAFLEGYIVNQIICMSTCDIEVGEELLAYYGSEVDQGNWKDESTPSEPDSEP